MISIEHVRRLALAVLVSAAACGDDGGGDDDGPPPDGAVNTEAGALGDGGGGDLIDGGGGAIDGGPLLDAQAVDASPEELQMALNQQGMRTDLRRAELVFDGACRKRGSCQPQFAVPGCISTGIDMYQMGMRSGFSEVCLDTTLDLYSCFATLASCDFDLCEDIFLRMTDTCPLRDAGM